MVSLRRCQFLVALTVVLVSVAALCQQPKQTETELRFEISKEQQQWLIERDGYIKGPIRPNHVAELFVMQPQYVPDLAKPTVVEEILGTAAGQLVSQKQREFITMGRAFYLPSQASDTIPNHYHFRLYAVSEADARNMATAFIEDLTNRANAKREPYLVEQRTLKRQIASYKDDIPKKEAELKAVQTRLDELKGKVHYLSADEAEATVLELNKMLDALDVEIAGIQAKVSTIEKYIEKYKSKKVPGSEDTLVKLEQMLSEQAIELAGALARKEAATKIRNQAQEFYNLNSQKLKLPGTLRGLRQVLSARERDLRHVQQRLADPSPEMLPPKVYQNKVTIYPVRVDE